MAKCLRVGCWLPRVAPDFYGIGLCAEHYRQMFSGKIGADYDPSCREWPVDKAIELLESERRPGEKDRALARRLGISKDIVYRTCGRKWPVLRSATWEDLSEAVATARYGRMCEEARCVDSPGSPP